MTPTEIRQLAAAGFSADDIATIAEIVGGEAAERKAAVREGNRQRQIRHRSRSVTAVTRDMRDTPEKPTISIVASRVTNAPLARVEDNLLSFSLTGEKDKKKKDISCPFASEFNEIFWPAYPRKESKKDALKAYSQVRKTSSFDAIMSGLALYAEKVAGKETTYIKLAGGWLRDERFADDAVPSEASEIMKFVPSDSPGYRMLKVRWQNNHDLQDPPIIERGAMSGSEFPATWIEERDDASGQGIRGPSDQVYPINGAKGGAAQGQGKNIGSSHQEGREPERVAGMAGLLQVKGFELFGRSDGNRH